jgi:hypothetical protein
MRCVLVSANSSHIRDINAQTAWSSIPGRDREFSLSHHVQTVSHNHRAFYPTCTDGALFLRSICRNAKLTKCGCLECVELFTTVHPIRLHGVVTQGQIYRYICNIYGGGQTPHVFPPNLPSLLLFTLPHSRSYLIIYQC